MEGGTLAMQQQKRVKTISTFILAALIAFLLFPTDTTYAETADGYYTIDYEVLSADSDSVSMANDYFEKPATMIVENGEKQLQLTINHSAWVVGLQAPQEDDFVDVTVISEDEAEDTRVVEFQVADDHDLSDPIEMKMHIVVDVLEEDYDNHYTARFAFDEGSMEEVDAPEVEDEEPIEEAEESEDTAIEDESSTATTLDDDLSSGANSGTLIVIVLLAAIAVILLYSFVFKKKK